jgi:hypothetical protein
MWNEVVFIYETETELVRFHPGSIGGTQLVARGHGPEAKPP